MMIDRSSIWVLYKSNITIINFMSTAFIVPDIACIYSTIEDLLYMSESQSSINTSFGVNEDEYEFIKFNFRLKHGSVEVTIHEDNGSFSYIDRNQKVLESTEFDRTDFTSMSGSFYQAFKCVLSLDRQQANTTNVTNTPVDRASFGLAEVN
jgi:hypothetical protein